MRVKATYHLTIAVTRDVEIDDREFKDWREAAAANGEHHLKDDAAVLAFLNEADDELHSNVFHDWRLSSPMPSDFEFQHHDIIEVEMPEGSAD